MKNIYKIFIITFFYFSCSVLLGQDNTPTQGITIAARSFTDSVMVRWAPLNFISWYQGNKKGYRLKKTIYKGNEILEELTIGIFKPIPLEEWQLLAEKDEYALSASGLIYADPPENTGLNQTDLAKMNMNRHNFALLCADMSVLVAKNMGLCFVDTDIRPGLNYSYQISFVEEIKDVIGFDNVNINPEELFRLPTLNEFTGDYGDLVVETEWLRNNYYSGFYIEISEDGGKTFSKVNDKPFVPMTSIFTEEENPKLFFKAELPENFKEYTLRVRGRDAFGQLSPPSNTITGVGRPAPIPVQPFIGDVSENIEGQFDIEWYINESYLDKMKGFNIYRSIFNKDNYVKLNKELLAPTTRFYRDKNPESANFYYIELIDENDHSIKSISGIGQLEDHRPPAAPEWIGGIADTTGQITLNWLPNSEEDFKGYHVYVGNNRNSVFSTYTSGGSVRDTFFMDSIEVMTLADSVYYKLKAIDFRGNFSPFSEVLAVARPDVIPPVSPVFSKKRAMPGRIELKWTNSASKDAVFTELQRKMKTEEEWEVIYKNTKVAAEINYADTTANYKHIYDYRLVAEDEVGLKGISKVVSLKSIDTGKREPISNVDISYEEKSELVRIKWDYPVDTKQSNIIIYRAVDKGNVTTYKRLKKEDLKQQKLGEFIRYTFEDGKVSNNHTYRYQIIINHQDGGFSPLTAPLLIDIIDEVEKRGKEK